MSVCQITHLKTNLPARIQLFCLPYAGGNGSFYTQWRDHLPDDIALHLVSFSSKGRLLGPLSSDYPSSIQQMAEIIAKTIMANCDLSTPWAVFGHSMGAVVGLELVITLLKLGMPPPLLLTVSSHVAPQYHAPDHLCAIDDEGICHFLSQMGGTAAAMLASPGIRKMILRSTRQDVELLVNWTPPPPQPLPCPLSAFFGQDDVLVDRHVMQGWSKWTSATFSCHEFLGDHFYFSQNPYPMLQQLLKQLDLAHQEQNIHS